MSNIILKRATLNDLPEIAKLEKTASSKIYSARVEENELKDFINNEFVFLVKKGDKVIGLVAYKIIKNKIAHINGLVINPEFQGQGFAKQTMSLLLGKIGRRPRIELVVHPHNTPAISLYLSLGFIIEAWRNNHFGDGQPRLVMAKNK